MVFAFWLNQILNLDYEWVCLLNPLIISVVITITSFLHWNVKLIEVGWPFYNHLGFQNFDRSIIFVDILLESRIIDQQIRPCGMWHHRSDWGADLSASFAKMTNIIKHDFDFKFQLFPFSLLFNDRLFEILLKILLAGRYDSCLCIVL